MKTRPSQNATDENSIKCLAVQQPWAWAICVGAKDIENRTWTTKYRGTIALIASGKETRVNAIIRAAKPKKLNVDLFTFSAVIGFVDLVEIEPLNQELEKNPWAWGPYCWRLGNPRLLQNPIPCKAKLNLYAPEPPLGSKIEAQRNLLAPIQLDDRAREWIEFSKELDQPRTWGHIVSYEAVGDWPSMERLSRDGLRTDPNDPDLLHSLALALGEQEKDAEALEIAEKLVVASPKFPAGYYIRGMAHYNLGDRSKAEADMARAKKLDPEIDTTLPDASKSED